MQVVFEAVELDPRNHSGQSLLHMAVDCQTPVDEFHTNLAVQFPSASASKALLEAGADPDAIDHEKTNPLHLIVTYPKIINDFITLHGIITALVSSGKLG